jgi:hypothetical protein
MNLNMFVTKRAALSDGPSHFDPTIESRPGLAPGPYSTFTLIRGSIIHSLPTRDYGDTVSDA